MKNIQALLMKRTFRFQGLVNTEMDILQGNAQMLQMLHSFVITINQLYFLRLVVLEPITIIVFFNKSPYIEIRLVILVVEILFWVIQLTKHHQLLLFHIYSLQPNRISSFLQKYIFHRQHLATSPQGCFLSSYWVFYRNATDETDESPK